jgi:hypothetical protein
VNAAIAWNDGGKYSSVTDLCTGCAMVRFPPPEPVHFTSALTAAPPSPPTRCWPHCGSAGAGATPPAAVPTPAPPTRAWSWATASHKATGRPAASFARSCTRTRRAAPHCPCPTVLPCASPPCLPTTRRGGPQHSCASLLLLRLASRNHCERLCCCVKRRTMRGAQHEVDMAHLLTRLVDNPRPAQALRCRHC